MSFISRILKPSTRPGEAETAAGSPSLLPSQQPQQQGKPKQLAQRRPVRSQAVEPADTLKIVIRGDSSVGKSCLLARLQGGAFIEEYAPTERPRSAIIRWKCDSRSATLQVWDAVDSGRPRRARAGLKLANDCDNRSPRGAASAAVSGGSAGSDEAAAAAAYAGCHGVVLMLDMTKAWTMAYVERELARAPPDLPVLVLANHRDMGHHRSVTADQARMAIRESGRRLEITRYAESSMRNGYGLKYVHRFLCLPYLCAQRQRLLQRLEANTEDRTTAVLELQLEEEESRQANDGQQQTSVTDTAPKTPSPLPSQSPPAVVGRLSAPPARLIPGAEQYLMELRRAQLPQPPQPPSTQPQQPQPPPHHQPKLPSSPTPPPLSPSRPEPAGADDERSSQSSSQRSPTAADAAEVGVEAIDGVANADVDVADDVDSDDASPGAVVSTHFDDVAELDDSAVAAFAADADAVDGDGDEAEDAEQVETVAVPPVPAPVIDWGPLLAKYEDEPAESQVLPEPSAEEQKQQTKKKRKKKTKQQQQQPVEPEQPEPPVRPKSKSKSKVKLEKSVKTKSGKRAIASEQQQQQQQ
uniref:Rab11 family GTPase n=1 Tax=Macrostomum lignano TaxID=282301 RepID=A0A1I8HMP0_9PLAT